MLHVTTWLWGDKYGPHYLDRLRAALARNIKQPYRFIVLADKITSTDGRPIQDIELTKVKGCFARLRMFDPQWQFIREIKEDERIVQIDVDSIITGELDPLFDRDEPFVILQGGNYQPCPYNGALWMLRAGAHPEVWSDFSLEAASTISYHEFPDDQGWLWHKLPNAAGWQTGPTSGCYVYQKPGWKTGERLPDGARYVTFSGKRSPDKIAHLDWVQRHWYDRPGDSLHVFPAGTEEVQAHTV